MPWPRTMAAVIVLAAASTSGCRAPTRSEARAAEADCTQVTKPTDADVADALAFASDILTPDQWARSDSAKDLRVNVVWLNASQGGLALQEYLLYPCGYTQADLDDYFSDENLKTVLFRDYQDLEAVVSCQADGGRLRLREFTAGSQGRPYRIRYWANKLSDTRVRLFLLALPEPSGRTFEDYSLRLSPALPSCRPR